MLEFSHIIYEIVIGLFLVYGTAVTVIYGWIGIYALGAVLRYKKENTFTDYSIIAANPNAPVFSLIAPAYNEGMTIVDNVRSLLSLYYHNLEIIIVNDGSKDDSLQKLISQKIKKGYSEISENAEIPQKKELSGNEKAEIYFWEAIEKSNRFKKAHWSEYDIDEHLENLTIYLSKFGKERLILFEKTLQEKLSELYTAEIAELSIILECEFKAENGNYVFNDYLSDDVFIYLFIYLFQMLAFAKRKRVF
ncbi:glycosyltransferase [Chryseobacterium lactis]|uniref:glycosyltransferase n=1 Tax=Chryseobacterium lactis TaxID=1241981 RepID=UPI0021AB727C|nr:glycosyltransferase [Chryseobacterium lactis]